MKKPFPFHSLVESVTDDNHLATTAFYGLAPHNAAHWLELHCAVGHVMLNRFFSLNAAGNVCKQPSCTRLPPEERHLSGIISWAAGAYEQGAFAALIAAFNRPDHNGHVATLPHGFAQHVALDDAAVPPLSIHFMGGARKNLIGDTLARIDHWHTIPEAILGTAEEASPAGRRLAKRPTLQSTEGCGIFPGASWQGPIVTGNEISTIAHVATADGCIRCSSNIRFPFIFPTVLAHPEGPSGDPAPVNASGQEDITIHCMGLRSKPDPSLPNVLQFFWKYSLSLCYGCIDATEDHFGPNGIEPAGGRHAHHRLVTAVLATPTARALTATYWPRSQAHMGHRNRIQFKPAHIGAHMRRPPVYAVIAAHLALLPYATEASRSVRAWLDGIKVPAHSAPARRLQLFGFSAGVPLTFVLAQASTFIPGLLAANVTVGGAPIPHPTCLLLHADRHSVGRRCPLHLVHVYEDRASPLQLQSPDDTVTAFLSIQFILERLGWELHAEILTDQDFAYQEIFPYPLSLSRFIAGASCHAYWHLVLHWHSLAEEAMDPRRWRIAQHRHETPPALAPTPPGVRVHHMHTIARRVAITDNNQSTLMRGQLLLALINSATDLPGFTESLRTKILQQFTGVSEFHELRGPSLSLQQRDGLSDFWTNPNDNMTPLLKQCFEVGLDDYLRATNSRADANPIKLAFHQFF